MLDLYILSESDSKLILGIPVKGRFLFLGIALFLAWGMYLTRTFAVVPAIIIALCLTAVLYTEEWMFDNTLKRVFHRHGLLLLNRKREYSMDDITRIAVIDSSPGGLPEGSADRPGNSGRIAGLDDKTRRKIFQKGFSGLFLFLGDEKKVNVHTTSIRKSYEQQELGRAIARVCGKPFKTE